MATERLKESFARAGIEQITLTDLTKKGGEAALITAERLRKMALVAEITARIQLTELNEEMKKLMENELDVAIEADILAYEWEKSMSSMEEDTLAFMGTIIPSMAFMAEETTKDVEEMGKKTKMTFNQIAGDVGMALHMIGTKNKAVALAAAIINTAQAVTKALSAYPPPWSFIMAALQGAAGLAEIKTIKKQKIPTAEKGAYLPSPAIIEAGHGPKGEVILPLDKAPTLGRDINIKADFNVENLTVRSDEDVEHIEEAFRRNVDGFSEKIAGHLRRFA